MQEPDETDKPFNEPVTNTLGPGQQVTVTFTATQRSGEFVVPALGISKHAAMTYEVRMDNETVYGPAEVPPTDIDDMGTTFYPPRRFSRTMEVRMTNLSSSTTRTTVAEARGRWLLRR